MMELKTNNKNKKKNKSYERGVVVVSVEKLKVGSSSIYSSRSARQAAAAAGKFIVHVQQSGRQAGRQAAGKRVVRIGSRLSIWLDWRQKV